MACLPPPDSEVRANPDDYYYENEDFHSRIYSASHNVFLAAQACQFKQHLKEFSELPQKPEQAAEG